MWHSIPIPYCLNLNTVVNIHVKIKEIYVLHVTVITLSPLTTLSTGFSTTYVKIYF